MVFTSLAAVLLGALFGTAARLIAVRRGEDGRAAFCFGFFLWALGLALVAFRTPAPARGRR